LTVEGWTYLAYSSDNSLALRSLPYGEIFAVSKDPGNPTMASMALVGHVEIDQTFEVFLHNITNEVKLLWHKEYYLSSTKKRKK
jgi:hypothetical protein